MQSRLILPQRHRRGQDERAAVLVKQLASDHLRIERMVQRQGAAAEQPRHQRQTQARERSGRDGRENIRILLQPAFEQDSHAAGQEFKMPPRHRHWTGFAQLEGDDSDMGCRVRLTFKWRDWIGPYGGQKIVERHDAVRQVRAEATDIAD